MARSCDGSWGRPDAGTCVGTGRNSGRARYPSAALAGSASAVICRTTRRLSAATGSCRVLSPETRPPVSAVQAGTWPACVPARLVRRARDSHPPFPPPCRGERCVDAAERMPRTEPVRRAHLPPLESLTIGNAVQMSQVSFTGNKKPPSPAKAFREGGCHRTNFTHTSSANDRRLEGQRPNEGSRETPLKHRGAIIGRDMPKPAWVVARTVCLSNVSLVGLRRSLASASPTVCPSCSRSKASSAAFSATRLTDRAPAVASSASCGAPTYSHSGRYLTAVRPAQNARQVHQANARNRARSLAWL